MPPKSTKKGKKSKATSGRGSSGSGDKMTKKGKNPKAPSGQGFSGSGNKITKTRRGTTAPGAPPHTRETRSMARARREAQALLEEVESATADSPSTQPVRSVSVIMPDEPAPSTNQPPLTQHDARTSDPPPPTHVTRAMTRTKNETRALPQEAESAAADGPSTQLARLASPIISEMPGGAEVSISQALSTQLGISQAPPPRLDSSPHVAAGNSNAGSPNHPASTMSPVIDATYYTPWANEEEKKRGGHPSFESFVDHPLRLGGVEWEELDDQIRELCDCAVPPEVSWQSLDATTQAKLLAFCPNAEKFAAKAFGSLVRGWIWRIIYDNLLSPDCMDKWVGKDWESFGQLQHTFRGHRDTAEDNVYNFMHNYTRHLTAFMLYMRHGRYHADPARLGKIILDNITPIPGLKHWIENDGLDPFIDEDFHLRRTVFAIAEQAVLVDFTVQASLWKIVIEMHDPVTGQTSGFPFSKRLMKWQSPGFVFADHGQGLLQGQPVELIISPLIRFMGGGTVRLFGDPTLADGINPLMRHYNKCYYVIPMKVYAKGDRNQPDGEPKVITGGEFFRELRGC